MECRTTTRVAVEESGGGNWGSDHSSICGGGGGSYGNQDQSNNGWWLQGEPAEHGDWQWMGMMEVVTTTAGLAMNSTAMEVELAWAEVTMVDSVSLVGLHTQF